MLFVTALVFCLISGITPKSFPSPKTKCGYESCPYADPDALNVHIVPHSHDDVGWLKTVEQYYNGDEVKIQHAGVQYIIQSVILALSKNPNRRFVQVETAFFHKWWKHQSKQVKEIVRKLVNNGQLEFIGGAWSMNDEAAVHYQSVIDQFTLGLRFLNETFGKCARPRIGWQIDPFGHSREMASIFARMGYDGLFFSRLDWRDKVTRLKSKKPEIIWKGSSSLDVNSSHLFTSVLFNHYSAPKGFCFDVTCRDEPIIDDTESPLYNLQTKVQNFAAFIRKQARRYQTNNIIITMGDDFNYQDALSYFANLDLLISGFQEFQQEYKGKNISVFYSTPSCYLKAVHEAAERDSLTFPMKEDDFFPYATDFHAYWTGYYTSRPTSKRFEREGNNLLQVAKQLTSFVGIDEDVTILKQAMGVMQHHDAITGTEKQHVAHDYHRMLDFAFQKSINASSNAIKKLLSDGSSDLELTSCLLANMTICAESNQENFTVIVYNPLSRSISHYIKLPVNSTLFRILDSNETEVTYQVAKPPRDFSYTEKNVSKYDLVFRAKDLPPLGLKVYRVSTLDPDDDNPTLEPVTGDKKYTITNDVVTVLVDAATGKLSNVNFNKTSLKVWQELMFYIGAQGNNQVFNKRSSGAYIFRPMKAVPYALATAETVQITTYKGPLFEEIQQVYNEWLTQVIRIYPGETHVEFDWIVGPIDTSDLPRSTGIVIYPSMPDRSSTRIKLGREIISRFSTELKTNYTFYTDSNGREMLKRIKDYRSDYKYTNEEPTASNYYPVTSKITLKEEARGLQFSVLNDRAQGGTSLELGQVELMVHRRCLHDDAFGVGESLEEEEYGQGLVARGQHYLTLNSFATAAQVERDLAQRKLLAPWIFLTSSTADNLKDEFSGLNEELPLNVQLLTLEPLDKTSILIRLEHIFEKNEDANFSEPVDVNLKGLFKTFEIVSLKETALAADRLLEEVERLQWNIDANSTFYSLADDFTISLSPMEIRTFIAKIRRIKS